MWLARFLFLLGMITVLGCGSGASAPPDADEAAAGLLDSVKSALQDVADSGEIGEAFGEARGMTEELKETDASKADSILKDLDALEALTTPDERKAKAKEIISSL